MAGAEKNFIQPSEQDDSQVEQPENVEAAEKRADLSTEQEPLGTDEARVMEESVVKRVVDELKKRFGDRLNKLSNNVKQRVTKALAVLFLATSIAGIAPTKSSYAAELDRDKDQQEEKGDYIEPDPEEILGFEVSYMTEQEADDMMNNMVDSLKTSGPKGERLSTNESLESEDDYNKDIQGVLPMEAEDIIVRGGAISITHKAQGDNKDFFKKFGVYDEVVNVENVEPIGDTFDMTGRGENPQDAIRNALENSGQYIESSISSNSQMSTSESGDSLQREFQRHLQITYDQAINSYKVLEVNEVEQNGIKFFEAKVTVQPGQVTN